MSIGKSGTFHDNGIQYSQERGCSVLIWQTYGLILVAKMLPGHHSLSLSKLPYTKKHSMKAEQSAQWKEACLTRISRESIV